jgi:hypothetical protein
MTGYLARLWRGQLALAQSCGINGLLVVLPLALWARLNAAHPPTSLTAFAVFTLLPLLFILALGVLSAVGIWRSTTRRPMFGRQESVWATRIAQVLVVLNVILAIAAGARLVADVRTLIAARQHPGQGYEVALRGASAVFSGRLNAAAVGEVQLLLGDKSVRRLVITDGVGGDEATALPLAKLIHERKISVVALARCDAACTLLLAAGSVRAIVPTTLLTFGGDARIYRAAGLAGMPASLLASPGNTARIDPPIRTLIEDGFVTSIFVAKTRHYVRAPQWCAKNLVACARTGRQNDEAPATPGGE